MPRAIGGSSSSSTRSGSERVRELSRSFGFDLRPLVSGRQGVRGALFSEGCGPAAWPGSGSRLRYRRLMVPFLRAGYRSTASTRRGDARSGAREARRRGVDPAPRFASLWKPSICRIVTPSSSSRLARSSFICVGCRAARGIPAVRTHLSPGGRFLFGTYIPADEIAKAPSIPWYVRRDVLRPDDGARVRCHERIEIDTSARVRTATNATRSSATACCLRRAASRSACSGAARTSTRRSWPRPLRRVRDDRGLYASGRRAGQRALTFFPRPRRYRLNRSLVSTVLQEARRHAACRDERKLSFT